MVDILDGKRWKMVEGEALRLLRELPHASVDAVITDEPYSSGGFTRGDRSIPTSKKYVMTGTHLERPEFAGDNRDQRSFGYWCALWLAECLRVAKPGAPICMFSDWRQLPTVTDAIQAGGWVWRGIVPWDKTEACRPAMGRFAAQAEFIVWGTAGPSLDLEEVGCLWGVIRCPVPSDKLHITEKPVAAMRHLVRICRPDGIILDPFAGVGSTGVGALLEGRRFLGFEVIGSYAADARDRLTAEEQSSTLQALRAGQLPLLTTLERKGEDGKEEEGRSEERQGERQEQRPT